MYREIGDHDKAIASYREAININPKFAQAYFNLGIVHSESRDYDNAIKTYKLAINIKPDFFEAHNNLGLAFQEKVS